MYSEVKAHESFRYRSKIYEDIQKLLHLNSICCNKQENPTDKEIYEAEKVISFESQTNNNYSMSLIKNQYKKQQKIIKIKMYQLFNLLSKLKQELPYLLQLLK